MRAPRWRSIGLYLALWVGITLAFATQEYTLDLLEQRAANFLLSLGRSFNAWMSWAAAAPLVIVAARRWPLDAERWRRHLPAHLVAMVGVVAVHVLLYTLFHELTYRRVPGESIWAAVTFFFVTSATMDCLVYWAIVGLTHATAFYRLYREREIAASRLETQLARSELETLKSQLHPHFFFNTLNTVSSLMQRDVEGASRVVSRLGELLRISLRHGESQETTLREELDFLAHYLAIQRIRFDDRLTVTVDAPEETLEALVPSLLLQPLVENAIRYAIEPRATPGRVAIGARIEADRLAIEIRDDGPGMPPAALEAFRSGASNGGSNGFGIGLGNTRARLEQLYGARHRFELSAVEPSGLRLRIELPLGYDAARTVAEAQS
ncbi:MAG: sensor histidine kinase [Gemmatimonadales bacterium]